MGMNWLEYMLAKPLFIGIILEPYTGNFIHITNVIGPKELSKVLEENDNFVNIYHFDIDTGKLEPVEWGLWINFVSHLSLSGMD